jgi:hypothetical protein
LVKGKEEFKVGIKIKALNVKFGVIEQLSKNPR